MNPCQYFTQIKMKTNKKIQYNKKLKVIKKWMKKIKIKLKMTRVKKWLKKKMRIYYTQMKQMDIGYKENQQIILKKLQKFLRLKKEF